MTKKDIKVFIKVWTLCYKQFSMINESISQITSNYAMIPKVE